MIVTLLVPAKIAKNVGEILNSNGISVGVQVVENTHKYSLLADHAFLNLEDSASALQNAGINLKKIGVRVVSR